MSTKKVSPDVAAGCVFGKIRDARIQACKVMYPGLTNSKDPTKAAKKARVCSCARFNTLMSLEPCRHILCFVRVIVWQPKKKPSKRKGGPKMYGGLKKYHENESFEVVLKLLHKNASKIINPSDPNATGTTANVWLLRNEEPLPEGQV